MKKTDRTNRSFSVLGINEDAGLVELRKAYRTKASVLHPDVCPGDPVAAEAFKKINAAYQHLKKYIKDNEKNKKSSKKITRATQYSHVSPGVSTGQGFKKNQQLPVDELIMRIRHSENIYVRIHAIKAITEVGGKEAAWALLPSLNDNNLEVAAAAVLALGKLKARIATIPLIHLYKKSGTGMRLYVERALGEINSPVAVRFLSLINDTDAFIA